jgi:hypothetical protein
MTTTTIVQDAPAFVKPIDLTDRATYDALTPSRQRTLALTHARRAVEMLPLLPLRETLAAILDRAGQHPNWVDLFAAAYDTRSPAASDVGGRMASACTGARNAVGAAVYQTCDPLALEMVSWEARHVAGCLTATGPGQPQYNAAHRAEYAAQVGILRALLAHADLYGEER